MRTPYMKPGLRWEDPIDGHGPRKHRSQKKGARQVGKRTIRDGIEDVRPPAPHPGVKEE